jgi:hypothetical protein
MPGEPSSSPDLTSAQVLGQEQERAREVRRQVDELRDRTVTELLQARQRCLDRLGSLSRELAEIRRYGNEADPGADVLLERTLGFAMHLREIIDDVRREVVSISIAAVEVPSGAALTDRAADGGTDDAGAPSDPDTFWLSAVMRHVPRAIVASMLQAVNIDIVNSIALRRPELLGTLVSELSAVDAAQWLPLWRDEAVVRVLSTVAPSVAAGCLEEMPPEPAVAVLTAMPGREGVKVLAALPQEIASRIISAMDPMAAARLLQRLEPEDAAEHLLQMEELGLAKHGQFVPLMPAETGERCLRAMDKKRSERTEAVDLIRQVEIQRNNPGK